jgi:hypothetical protein
MNKIPGKSFPLGATACPDGVNFSVFAKVVRPCSYYYWARFQTS